MGFINLCVEKSCKVQIENNKLKLTSDVEALFPLEDINALILENQYSTITTSALSKLCQEGVVTYLCNEKHVPNGYILPYASYYAKLATLKMQLCMNKPKIKRLWQDIVIRKIENQAKNLSKFDLEKSNDLLALTKQVQSGDGTNVEAQAAKLYFRALFGQEFSRDADCLFNVAANYTYAIVRGLIARTLVCHGFECSLGLFHKNKLNAFNLVDDLLEPYRGIIDYFVIKTIEDEESLSPQLKRRLLSIFNIDVSVQNCLQSLNRSVEIFVASLLSVINEESEKLKMPELVELKIHCYE